MYREEWKKTKFKQLCDSCFGENPREMYDHAKTYLKKGYEAVTELGKTFRDIAGSVNRTEFWGDALVWLRLTFPHLLPEELFPLEFPAIPHAYRKGSLTVLCAPDALRQLFGGNDARIAEGLLSDTYFVEPKKVKVEPLFPAFVRKSNEYYPGKKRGDQAIFRDETGNEQEVKVDVNQKARMAFGRAMNPAKLSRKGYDIAHIWERTHDPKFFTAAWNLCCIQAFLRPFVENQLPMVVLLNDSPVLLKHVLVQAAFNLYFKPNPHNANTPLSTPDGVWQPEITLESLQWEYRLL